MTIFLQSESRLRAKYKAFRPVGAEAPTIVNSPVCRTSEVGSPWSEGPLTFLHNRGRKWLLIRRHLIAIR